MSNQVGETCMGLPKGARVRQLVGARVGVMIIGLNLSSCERQRLPRQSPAESQYSRNTEDPDLAIGTEEDTLP